MKRTRLEAIEAQALPLVFKLPKPVLQRAFGRPPVNDRGAPLDLQSHVLCRLIELTGKPELSQVPTAEARRIYHHGQMILDIHPIALHDVHDLRLEGPQGSIPARVYRPRPGRLPAVVYYHGGGFVIGDLETHDGFCRFLADRLDAVVISVGYRLAPEHPFPAAVDDAYSAFVGVRAQARELEIDLGRIGVAGDSAGGNLAAVVSQECIDNDHERPAFQALIYPGVDFAEHYPSKELFYEGFYISTPASTWFFDTYLQTFDDPHHPRVAPLRYERLSEMPATYVITAGFDPLRDEGDAYARKLADAGVHVVHRCAEQLTHGFAGFGGCIDAARHMLEDVAVEIARLI